MEAAMREERRRYLRVAVRAEATLVRNGTKARLPVRDISIGGAFLAVPLSDHIELKTGGRFALTLIIDEEMPSPGEEDGSTVHTQARIVRRDPGGDGRPAGVGVAFERIDLDNLTRIHALLGHLAED
jgi:c-di-GMP-binding flagellar brake protein YcgR